MRALFRSMNHRVMVAFHLEKPELDRWAELERELRRLVDLMTTLNGKTPTETSALKDLLDE